MTETEENNRRAVLLSEEIDFLEEMAKTPSLPAKITQALMSRRDTLRAAMRTADQVAAPDAQAEEGTPLP